MRITTHNVDHCGCEQCHQWRLESLAARAARAAETVNLILHERQERRMTHWKRRKMGR
jgi:hypothetical protein